MDEEYKSPQPKKMDKLNEDNLAENGGNEEVNNEGKQGAFYRTERKRVPQLPFSIEEGAVNTFEPLNQTTQLRRPREKMTVDIPVRVETLNMSRLQTGDQLQTAADLDEIIVADPIDEE